MRKKWWCHWLLKLFAILISIGTIIFTTNAVYDYVRKTASINIQSIDFEYTMYDGYQSIIDYYLVYQSEEYVKEGNLIDNASLDNIYQRFAEDYEYQLAKCLNEFNLSIPQYEEMLKNNVEINSELVSKIKKIQDDYDLNITKYRESLIRTQLAEFKQLEEKVLALDSYFEYIIYLKNDTIISNLEEELNNSNVVSYFINHLYYDDYNIGYYNPYIGGYDVSFTPDIVSEVYVCIKDEYIKEYQEENERVSAIIDNYTQLNNSLSAALAYGFFIILIASIYLFIVAGESYDDDKIHTNVLDNIYLDAYAVMVGVILFVAMILVKGYGFDNFNTTDGASSNLAIVVMMILSFTYIVVLTFGLSISKHLKMHDFLKHNFMYWIFSVIIKLLVMVVEMIQRILFGNASVSRSLQSLIVLGMILNICWVGICLFIWMVYFSMDGFGFLLMGTIGFVVEYLVINLIFNSYIKDLELIKSGVNIIQQGDLDYQISGLNNTSLRLMANDINAISDGLKVSVEKAVASEKMKSELVTNVSHDLKTPLTSIINYIDLLSKKNDFDDDAKHYIEIIVNKSNQLKKLVEDLFEMTKAQSGQIKVELNQLSLDDLLTQSLVEFEDMLQAKKLEVRVLPLDKKAMVLADSNRTWRVLSNVIGNIVKYGLENTRVYINYFERDDEIDLVFKNVSSYEMDFQGEEMLERFNRGDKSRNSDGNGLGLAIASSFMELQGGRVRVNVDGDLFKVCLSFTKIK